MADLRHFKIDFLSARRNLSDVGEGDARRHLMTRLPHFMTEKAITKEIEHGKKNPRVIVSLGKEVPLELISRVV